LYKGAVVNAHRERDSTAVSSKAWDNSGKSK
jgi:hypothetical protein